MSDQPIAARLQVKGDRRLAVIDAPVGVDAAIGGAAARAAPEAAEVVLLFARGRAALNDGLDRWLPRLGPACILWVGYPKLTSMLAKDLHRDVIRAAMIARGMDTVGQIAIDQDWSAMRLKRCA
jgi:hypothetical protein